MTIILPSLCRACSRLDRSDPLPHLCEAYPDGIPQEIIAWGEDHREARGDEVDGLVFEQADTVRARHAFDEWEDRVADEATERPTARSQDTDSLLLRGILRGKDITPGHDELHHYWTRGEGLAKWAKSPHPWTALYHHLVKYVGPERAKRMASQWHHEVFGIWVGEKKGQNPVGPG